MPIERRQIMLSETEVLHAIQAYGRMRSNFLPHGEVTGYKLTPAGNSGVQLSISIGMTYGQTRQTINIEAVATDVVEMLIRFCLENNIPIPKIGHKSAGVTDGSLTLTICSNDEDLDCDLASAAVYPSL